VELITVSINSLQIIFHPLMIVALLQANVVEVKSIQHPVAHLFPRVEPMKETVITILNAKKSLSVELITVSIYSLQIIFHQLMIAALLQANVVEIKQTQHPVAHLFPHVESMKETVITILNAKKSLFVELITVSIFSLQIIFHQLMIAALLQANVVEVKQTQHPVALRFPHVESMKETVITILNAKKSLFVELITVSIYSLQIFFHQLMIVAMLKLNVVEVNLIQHPVAHLIPHVESMKETVITILNVKES
jgi:uncharacterized protein YlzI (FlbEa/FlbD family)